MRFLERGFRHFHGLRCGLKAGTLELADDVVSGGFIALGSGLAALQLVGGEELDVGPPGVTRGGEEEERDGPHDPV